MSSTNKPELANARRVNQAISDSIERVFGAEARKAAEADPATLRRFQLELGKRQTR